MVDYQSVTCGCYCDGTPMVSKISLFTTFYLVTSYEFISNKGVKFIMKLKEAFWKSKWAYQGIKTFKGNNFVQKYYFLYSILSIPPIWYYLVIIKRHRISLWILSLWFLGVFILYKKIMDRHTVFDKASTTGFDLIGNCVH